MTAQATQTITRLGITPSYTAVAASDTFTPSNLTMLHIKNAGGSPDVVTVSISSNATAPIANLVLSMATVSVTNAQERMIGPFPAQFFADPTTGVATVAHSFTTTVTVGVFTLSAP